jgi:hypothetical protein
MQKMETLARIGYATKGVLYLVIGGLAVRYALGDGGKLTDNRGAMRTLHAEPFGGLLVWAAAAGLGAYAIWRLVQAIWDPESGRRDAKRLGQRIGYAVSGVTHAGLCVAAVQLALARGRSHGGGSVTYIGKVLAWPGGSWIIAGVGIAVLCVGGYELYQGYSARFMKRLSTATMSARERTWARRAGRMGLFAHGLVFAVVGWFLERAAASGQSTQARGLAGALHEIARRSHSTLLLAAVALGLVGYAVYLFFTARYLRVGWDA